MLTTRSSTTGSTVMFPAPATVSRLPVAAGVVSSRRARQPRPGTGTTQPRPGTAAPQRVLPVPAYALPHRTPRELLALARCGLAEAAEIRTDGMRYATAHLSALRAAAAVLSARAVAAPRGCRGRVTNVWTLLVLVAPEFQDWADFFATGATKRAAAEAGIPRVVTSREADDLLRSAEQFIGLVEVALGFSYQPLLEGLAS